MELIKHMPPGLTDYTEMHVYLLYKNDTDPERVILYALAGNYENRYVYVPSAQAFVRIEGNGSVDPLLPVYLYGGWAQSKVDKDAKFKWHSATMQLSSVVPAYIRNKRAPEPAEEETETDGTT